MSILGNPVTLGGGGSKVPDYAYTGNAEWYNEGKTILKLKTSGVLTLSKDCFADVFVVGGGASGAGSYGNYTPQISGGGGGGGYTKTQRVSFKKGTEYPAVIGAGGVGVANNKVNNGNVGGATSINGVSANGGQPGTSGYGSSSIAGTNYGNGGSGGSGGGSSFWGSTSYPGTGAGGTDGSSGTSNRISTGTLPGGSGQGTTTRAFGESDGELFAGGGGGASGNSVSSSPNGGAGGGGNGGGTNNSREATAGEENTGGGGGGAFYYASNILRYSGAGGSGVILIRFA